MTHIFRPAAIPFPGPVLTMLLAVVWLAIGLPTSSLAADTGADVTVHELSGTRHYGSEGNTHAYSIGTVACSQGTEPVSWCDAVNDGCLPGATVEDHPVIGQNLYRLKNGRFEQIGMSWLKHGFSAVAVASPGCGDGTCGQSVAERDFLEVGCTDAYSATQNGLQPLGPRSSVNPTTGEHPERPSGMVSGIDERLQVEEGDIDPGLNPGARYWVEGHYVTEDDSQDGNAMNNTSHREVIFQPGTLELILTGTTQRRASAITAWQAADPYVELVPVDLPDHQPAERFHAARRISGQVGDWHNEYVIHNLNSDRAARAFEIRFPGPVNISSAGFRDVDHHSGEPYDTTDWAIEIDGAQGLVRWSTDTYDIDEDANALRWGSMFSFWFDADEPLEGVVHTLELFKPGTPQQVDQVVVPFLDPAFIFSDEFESGDLSGWSGSMN